MTIKNTLLSLSLVLATSVTCAGALTPNDKPAHFHLEQYRKGVAVRVNVAGRGRLFQLDTAGGITVISPALAKELRCQPWGSITGFHMTGTKISSPRCDGVKLNIESFEFIAPVAAVMDVGVPESPLDGLLALDVFSSKTITIDFARGDFIVESRESAVERIRSAREIGAHIAREIGGMSLSMFIDVPSKNGLLRMELDSGNGGTILVSKPLREFLGLPKADDQPQYGSFRIAPGISASGLIFSPELVIDGNLGMPFLKNWVVTMDLDKGRVWLAPSLAPPPAGMGVAPSLPAR